MCIKFCTFRPLPFRLTFYVAQLRKLGKYSHLQQISLLSEQYKLTSILKRGLPTPHNHNNSTLQLKGNPLGKFWRRYIHILVLT